MAESHAPDPDPGQGGDTRWSTVRRAWARIAGGQENPQNTLMWAVLVLIAAAWLNAGTDRLRMLSTSCRYTPGTIVRQRPPATPMPVLPTAVPGGGQATTTVNGNGAPAAADRAVLLDDLSAFYQYVSCMYERRYYLDIAMKITALGFAFLTTIASSFRWVERGVIFGALATALVAVQAAFPFAEQAAQYRQIMARTDNLLSEARFKIDADAAQFERVRAEFQQVKADLVSVPRGSVPSAATPTPTTSGQNTPPPSPGAADGVTASPSPAPTP